MLEGPPEAFGEWSDADSFENPERSLLGLVESNLRLRPTRARLINDCMNLVSHTHVIVSVHSFSTKYETMEAVLENGDCVFLRQRKEWPDDPASERWAKNRAIRESQLLQWLSRNSRLPVPRLRYVYVVDGVVSVQITDRLPGKTMWCWPLLSTDLKVCQVPQCPRCEHVSCYHLGQCR